MALCTIHVRAYYWGTELIIRHLNSVSFEATLLGLFIARIGIATPIVHEFVSSAIMVVSGNS